MKKTSSEEKRILRSTYREIRKNLSVCEKESADELICEAVTSLSCFRFADTVLLYAPVGSEVNVKKIAHRAYECGKKVAFPVCNTEAHEMTFRYVSSLDELSAGSYSIPEPSADAEIFSQTPHALCIVPALAFDKNGFRLGYGGGYYDRFLKAFDGVALGVAYDSLITESLPKGIYDMPVDIIVTERRKIIPNAKK